MERNSNHIVNLNELESLFRQHYQFLCNSAWYVTGDEEAARDIVQEFFFYCWNKRTELAIASDFKGYAFRAIKNASLNFIKSARKHIANPELAFSVMSSEASPAKEDWKEEEERNKALWAAVDRLPAQRRLIFLLSNREGLTYAQIAGKLDISVNTVKTQIRLAYQYLREECRWLLFLFLLIFFKNN
jgi:RNA polymerase sigma-19 factor, ECF subfamily